MEARVNATGNIVDIIRNSAFDKDVFYDSNGQKYHREELSFDFKEKSFPKDENYWTRLEHQAAIAAMQGIVSSYEAMREISKEKDIPQYVANMAFGLSHALVVKLKEKEK